MEAGMEFRELDVDLRRGGPGGPGHERLYDTQQIYGWGYYRHIDLITRNISYSDQYPDHSSQRCIYLLGLQVDRETFAVQTTIAVILLSIGLLTITSIPSRKTAC